MLSAIRMNTQVRELGVADAEALFELRRLSYRASRDFALVGDEACLRWGPEDEASVVLGAFDDEGRMIATMRGQIIHDYELLEQQAGLARSMPPLFPTLYLSRAATLGENEGTGLNALLRLRLLEYALEHSMSSLSGMVTQGAVRARTLLDLGYRFFGDARDDEGLVAVAGPWRMVMLDLARHGAMAHHKLLGLCQSGLGRHRRETQSRRQGSRQDRLQP